MLQQIKHFSSVRNLPAREFTDHERVNAHSPSIELLHEPWVAGAEMLYPYRSVYKDHALFTRRRRMERKSGSLPPS